MDSTDLQPDEPRRRTSSTALLAAGSLTGLVLGLGGMAFAETPAPPDTGSSSAQQTATTDEGAEAGELCDEPGGRGGTGAEDSTADDSADAPAGTVSAAT